MSIRQQHLAGLFFIAFGAFAIWAGRELPIGTAGDMGVGYTPRALAIGCLAVGCVLLVQAFMTPRAADEVPFSVAWWPLGLVTVMVLAFALLLPVLGLPLTVILVTIPAALSGEEFRWTTLAAIAAGMALLTTALFAIALKLQIPVWPF